jgi:hypothetical protein
MSQGALQPLLLSLTDHPLPFIAPPHFLQEYLVCVISFLSLLDDYDMSSIFPFYVSFTSATNEEMDY